MQNLERRITALETIEPPPYRWVWREVGESAAAAKSRAAIADGENVIIFSWMDDHASH
jgi:hypothetical protein